MKTTDRLLPAFAFALLGAVLGALVCVVVVLKTDVTFASLPLFGGVGALVLGLVGFLKGPSGPGYVARATRGEFLRGMDDMSSPGRREQSFNVVPRGIGAAGDESLEGAESPFKD